MRGPDDHDALDALIDRVAQELTGAEPPAALAAVVQARVSARDTGGPLTWWQPVAAIAALLLAVLIATALWPSRQAQGPVVRRETPAAPGGGPADVSAGSAPQDPQHSTPSLAGRVRRSGPAGRAGQRESVEGLPPIAPLDVTPIDAPSLIADMSGLDMPIEIEPLQIAPLELQ